MPQKEPPSVDWRRIYALPYNHFFKDRAIESRLSLGLPRDGIADNMQAREWLQNHLRLKKPFLPHITTIPLWIALSTSPEKNLQKTDVPLLKWAVILAHDFKLPFRMRMFIGLYILTNDERLLTSWKGLDISFDVNTKSGKLQLSVSVDGIDAWTTKEEWLEVWDNSVRLLREALGEAIPRGKRPGRGNKLQKEIERWAEWYELSERRGLGPAKALGEWEHLHPEQAVMKRKGQDEHYDVSTVTKAVEEFRRLITPTNP